MLRTRHSLYTALTGAVAALLLLAPTVYAVRLGASPYEMVSQSSPGLDVVITAAVLRTIADAGLMLTLGSLVHLLFLQGDRARTCGEIQPSAALTTLQASSLTLSLAALMLTIFDALHVNGVSVAGASEGGLLRSLYSSTDLPRAWTFTAVVALLVGLTSFFARSWTAFLVMLLGSVLSMLSSIMVGPILVGPNHDFGSDVGYIHAVSAFPLFGAICVAAVLTARGHGLSRLAVRRLLRLGAIAWPLVAMSEVGLLFFFLQGSLRLDSPVGVLQGLRWATLLGLACAGILVRRRHRVGKSITTELLSVSALLCVAWLSVTVAMTRVPPPVYFVDTTIRQVFLGFEVPDAPGWATLALNWRPNLLFLAVAVAAVVLYVQGIRRLRVRGDPWPAGRTIAWVGGWMVVVIATSSGIGKYSGADFAVHMGVHMTLNMLVPALLVLGGPATLLLRATHANSRVPAGPRVWMVRLLGSRAVAWLFNPLVVFALYVGSYYGLYFTDLFGTLMRFHWGHQLMNLHFLAVGYLYFSHIVGIDHTPWQLPHIGKLGYALAAMPFHAFFGIVLMTSDTIVAKTFYSYLDLPWADLETSQYVGGAIAWAGGEVPLMLIVVVLAIQWSRQDSRDARRSDRHELRTADNRLDAYNDILRQLAGRRASQDEGVPASERTNESS